MTAMYELVDNDPEYGRCLIRRQGRGGRRSICRLPDLDAKGVIAIGAWVCPSPFPGTFKWEWVVYNMDVTVVTGMSSGYTRTRWGARRAARRALKFWESLGYNANHVLQENY